MKRLVLRTERILMLRPARSTRVGEPGRDRYRERTKPEDAHAKVRERIQAS